jgi:hypothetical protein
VASSSFSSPNQENDLPDKLMNSNHQSTFSATCSNSEEFVRHKKEEERECLKEAFDFLKLLAKKLKRSQAIVNTSMVFFLKYTRIISFTSINKYLVAAACLLLGAKCRDEPVPIEYLVEWYIYFETKRISKTSKVDISAHKKEEYSNRIKEQEFDILCEIGFDWEVDLPNKYIAQFAASPTGKTIFATPNCSKYAYMFMNDSFMTTCSLYYTSQEIAAAAIYMAYVYICSSTDKSNSNVDMSAMEDSEWYKCIDETLDLATIIEVKDEIKKCYAKKPSSS